MNILWTPIGSIIVTAPSRSIVLFRVTNRSVSLTLAINDKVKLKYFPKRIILFDQDGMRVTLK